MNVKRVRLVLGTMLLAGAAWAHAQVVPVASVPAAKADGAPSAAAPAGAVRQLKTNVNARTGDFDAMLKRRMIRVDAPYSRSLYFIDKGRERGLDAELIRDFERWLNKKYANELGKRPLTIYIAAESRDRLLSNVGEGIADIAIGNLTITPERLQQVDFVRPDRSRRIDEILVTGPASPPIAAIDDLAGRRVHVRRASSYHASLVALNARFAAAGRPAVDIALVPDALEDEDMMEMMNAGLLEAIVVDDWKARMWAQVLPKVLLHPAIVLRDDGETGWAIRKGSPGLAAELEDFFANWAKKQGVIPYRQQQYMKQVKALKDPTGTSDFRRFQETIELFRKYGAKYGFDPLMLAAQGYQESQLDQNAKSHVGAIGVMQVMPATGESLKVGDVRVTEANIHAGTKYMDQLMTKYFADAHFSDGNRPLFAFASYNCGPGNVAKMRREAEKRGLDPDKWFNNVEVVTAEKIGVETTTYVRNIYKYYVSYKLTLDAHAELQKAKAQMAPAKG